MTSATKARRAAAAALLTIVAVFAAACGPQTADDPTPEGIGSLGIVTEPTQAEPTQAEPTAQAPTYPSNAQAYAEAVLQAWAQDDTLWFGALTTAPTYDQLVELPGSVDDHWSFHRCDGAAGSSYCSFINTDGDVLTLRISNELLGSPHAAIQAFFDETTYPGDAVLYVKEFVKAWQFGNSVRMLLLSTPQVVGKVGKTAPTNPSYPAPTCCGGGLVQVKVNSGGTFARFDVGATLLPGPHAIVGYDKELGLTQ